MTATTDTNRKHLCTIWDDDVHWCAIIDSIRDDDDLDIDDVDMTNLRAERTEAGMWKVFLVDGGETAAENEGAR